MTEIIRRHLFISGRVQGVFFRASLRDQAKKLKVGGWVRNLPDGRVEAVLEGQKEEVEKLISWAKKGPILAKVEKVEVLTEEPSGEFQDFEIKR